MKIGHFTIHAGVIWILLIRTSVINYGQIRPSIECGCTKFDNYIEPASKGILVEQGEVVREGFSAKTDPKYTLTAEQAVAEGNVYISIQNKEGKVVFDESNSATGWGFSPDEDRFVMHGIYDGNHWVRLVNLNPDPAREGERGIVWYVIPPTKVSSASIRFSPNGRYLLYAAIPNNGGLFLRIFNTTDPTAHPVYEVITNQLVGSPSGKSVAGWGFSPDKKDATFVHAYLTDANKYTLAVKNLSSPDGEYVVYAPGMEGEAHWFFSPCGDYFAWIIDPPYSDLECRLYKTNSQDNYKSVSAINLWQLFSAEDGQYIRYKDNSTYKITGNTADETCPDKTRPVWENAVLDTGLIEGTTIELEWSGAKDNVGITAYRIYKDGKLFQEIDTVNHYTVSKLKPSTKYRFRIEAGDEAGNWSNTGPVDSFSTFSDSPPFWTDLSLTGSNMTETTITLQWKPASDDYGVEFYKILVNSDTIAKVGGDTLKYRIKGLTAGETDTFRILAGDAANQWVAGPVLIQSMPPAAPPTWPPGAVLSDTLVTETSLTVRWPSANDQFNAVKGYKISMNGNYLATTKPSKRSFDVKGLEEGTVYLFEVIAFDESDNESVPLTGYLSTLTGFVVMPLITDPSNQKMPDISGNLVVWCDDRNDGGDIYSYDLRTDTMRRITTDPHTQFDPAVDGQRIVWTDTRNGDWDIYMYDPVLGEIPICTAPGDQFLPAIDGDIIVWQDNRNGNYDIYMYDLSTMKESPVSTRPSNQKCPDVSGYYVAYQDDRNGNEDIYMYNIFTKKEYPVSTSRYDQTSPVITGKSGSRLAVAYNDKSTGDNISIYYPFIFSGLGYEWHLNLDHEPGVSIQINPHFEDNQLVYQDLYPVNDGKTWSIWAYKLNYAFPGMLDKIKEVSSNDQISQELPRTSQGNIVWQYNKGTDSDIYVMKRNPGSDLQLSLVKVNSPAIIGDTLKYDLTLTNRGPNNNMFIETQCTLPVMAKFISANADKGEVLNEGKNISWKIDTLRYLSEAKLTIKMVTFDIALLDFHAVTESGAFDPDPSNNQIHDTTKVSNAVARFIDSGDMPAMVVEKKGKIHMAYFRNDTLIYAVKTRKGSWQSRMLGQIPYSKEITMVMSPDSNLHMVFSDYIMRVIPGPAKKSEEIPGNKKDFNIPSVSEEIQSRLYHGILSTDGKWSSNIIALSDTGFHSLSLDCSIDNELYLAYQQAPYAANSGPLKIMKTINGIWQPAHVIFKDGYDHIDLKLDSENNLHLSFYSLNRPRGILYQKWNKDLAGPVEQVEPGWSGGQMNGMVTSIITDKNDQPHISYVGSVNNDHNENIKHAWKKDGQWHTEMVDNGSHVSSGNQVAMDPSGTPNFAYINHLTDELRFTTRISGSWIRQVVDVPQEGPLYCDIPPGAYPVLPQPLWGDVEFDMDDYRNGHLAISEIHGIKYAVVPPLQYFVVTPDTLDFEAVKPDSSKTLVLTLMNPSIKDIQIDDVCVDDSRFSFSKTSFILKKYQKDSIFVTFKQDTLAGELNSYISITYNNPSGLAINVPVMAKPWQPVLKADPESVVFDAVPLNTMETKTVKLENTGAANLIISDINVAYELWPGYTIPTDFSLTGHNCSTLQPGGTCEVQVSFQPLKDGPQFSYLNISSNDPKDTLKKIELSGNTPFAQIYTKSNSVDFGYCPLNQTLKDTLFVFNSGNSLLTITGISLSGTDKDQFSFINTCSSVNPGDSCIIEIMMKPTKTADLQATLQISSNSKWSKTLDVYLKGSSYFRVLELSAESINFVNTPVGEKTPFLLEIRNKGSTSISVSNISISGPDKFEFKHSYSYNACSLIIPGAKCIDTVWFAPIFEGSKTGTLNIISNDSYKPVQTVTLTGTAGPPAPLQLSISAVPVSGHSPLTVNFISELKGGQAPYTYFWNFDDSYTSKDPLPVHEFTDTGIYKVSLIVTDLKNNSVTDTITVTVVPVGVPVVTVTAVPASGEIPLNVQFNATVTGGDSILSFQWDFGDGTTSTQQNPSHTYSIPGTYKAKITVTDADGDTGKDSITIVVRWNNSIAGELWNETSAAHVSKANVFLFKQGSQPSISEIKLDGNYSYLFQDLPSGSYTVLAVPDTVSFPDELPTYLGDKLALFEATFVNVSGHITGKDIHLMRKPSTSNGTGIISGTLVLGTKKGIKVIETTDDVKADPVAGTYVYLKGTTDGKLKSYDITAANGSFDFSKLINGSYYFVADYQGKPMDAANNPIVISDYKNNIKILATVGTDKISVKDLSTGVIEENLDGIKVYPVPARDQIFLEIPDGIFTGNSIKISIHDLPGKEVFTDQDFTLSGNPVRIDIGNIPEGVYILRLTDNKKHYNLKVIKTR